MPISIRARPASRSLTVPFQPAGPSGPSPLDLAAMLVQVQKNQAEMMKAIQDVQWNQAVIATLIGQVGYAISPGQDNVIGGYVLHAGSALRSD